MTNKKHHWGIFTLNFVMFFLSLTLFGGSGVSLTLFGATPLVALCLLTVFSAFSRPAVSAMVGLACGIVTDSISSDSYCFNAIAFLILGMAASLLAEFVFNRNLSATAVLCFTLTLVYYIFYWLIFIAFSVSFKESTGYLLQWALPSCIYTALLSIPFYFIYRHFNKA